jgi:choline dehydrogenase-like flavoprotein
MYHPVGTCRMGDVADPGTVIDTQLRVKHVRKLRVIDASIMPSLPSCNTNGPTIMIAERGATLLIEG